MKTVAFPREKRTEFIIDADARAVTELVRSAIARAGGQILIWFAERQDEQGQTRTVAIACPMPRVGQKVSLTAGENVVGMFIFPAGSGAELLIADIKHSADCPRTQTDCLCAVNLTLREPDAGH